MDRQVLKATGVDYRREFLRLNLERAVTGPIYSDAHIERCARVYLANPVLRLFGVPFSYFLAGPEVWLRFIGDPMRNLSAARCAHRAEAAVADAERAEGHGENGRLVEKPRHHAYPRRQGRDFLPTRDA